MSGCQLTMEFLNMKCSNFILLLVVINLLSACNSNTIPTNSSNRGAEVVDITDTSGTKILSYSGSYALLIGESDYTAGWQDLQSIPSELNDVQKVLQEQGFVVERHSNLKYHELKMTFENFINNYGLDTNNRLLFFYSGHGHTRLNGNKGYIVPIDAPDPNVDDKGFIRKAVEMEQILTWARRIESKHALFLFDSCFSGTVFKTKDQLIPKQISKATKLPVRQFITAGSADEVVPARSIFTPAFVDALRHAKGDKNKDGYVTGMELGLYLWNKVPKHTEQTPQFGKIRDFPLSRGDFVFKVGADINDDVSTSVKTSNIPIRGSLIAYATMPNHSALGSTRQRNSLYSKHFLAALQNKKNVYLNDLFIEVTNKVMRASQNRQIPQHTVSLNRNFSFQECAISVSCFALVIGNDNYQYATLLSNSVNDATDIATVLRNLGFKVILKHNIRRREMKRAVREFSNLLKGSKQKKGLASMTNNNHVGLFYYSGNGIQYNGSNFIIPVDARINTIADIQYELVNLNWIFDMMTQTNNAVNIMVTDSCRDNPSFPVK
jgi:uncharacterized caspase-like protein